MASPGSLNALLIAADDGPRDTLRPLVGFCDRPLADVRTPAAGEIGYWSALMAERRPELMVVGTSNSARGRRIESAARCAATGARLPVAAIEDYPGNYFDVPHAATRLLVVESAFSERVYRARPNTPPMAIIPPARYDRWRGRAQDTAVPQAPYAVLWAGQPETAACVATLEWLLPQLAGLPLKLWFRAHPRDPALGGRVYGELLARGGVDSVDVSAEPLEATLARRLDLVVTQFSSVAVDAGFAGVPSLHLLLPAAGGGLLRQLKGYSIPAICDSGAAFLATGGPRDDLLRTALFDAAAREEVMRRFRVLYAVDTPTAQLVAAALQDIIS